MANETDGATVRLFVFFYQLIRHTIDLMVISQCGLRKCKNEDCFHVEGGIH